jgi:hypothetical protein
MNKETFFSPKPPIRDIEPQRVNCIDHREMEFEYFMHLLLNEKLMEDQE